MQTEKQSMMEDKNQIKDNNSKKYIPSHNKGNTLDNIDRSVKQEDPFSPSYSNPPLGGDMANDTAIPSKEESNKESGC